MLGGPVPLASAADAPASASPGEEDSAINEGEQVDVESIKKKYWARGDQSQLSVVQNRTYTKSNKWDLGGLGGIVNSDPFLTIKSVGGSLGYHFNEYFSFHLIGWKDLVSKSSALTSFEKFSGGTANTNYPKYFLGGEANGSLLYGKLSVLGKAIIYYDLHLSAGAGVTKTESGDYFTPMGGIGQRFYLSKNLSLRIDYRLQYYKERILEKEVPTKKGEVRGIRGNYSNCVTLGISFMFGFFSEKPAGDAK